MKLTRDSKSKAILNTDSKELRRINGQRRMRDDINHLKKEVSDLKKMINILLNER